MPKYLIVKNKKYFNSFGNHYRNKGKLKLKPIYGELHMAVYFHSKDDAIQTANRVNGNVIEA